MLHPCGNPQCSVMINPNRNQKGAITKGHLIFCSDKCRNVINGIRVTRWRKKNGLIKPLEPKICAYCGNKFIPTNPCQKYCPPNNGSAGCSYLVALKRNRGRYKPRNNTKKLKKTKSNRVCRYCGGDPAPNYFFCPGICHERASQRDGYDINDEHYSGRSV